MNEIAKRCRICLEVKTSCASIYQMVRENYLPSVIEFVCKVQISDDTEPDAQACMECAMAMIQAESIIKKFNASNEKLQREHQKKCEPGTSVFEAAQLEEQYADGETYLYDSQEEFLLDETLMRAEDQIIEYTEEVDSETEVYKFEEQLDEQIDKEVDVDEAQFTNVPEDEEMDLYDADQTELYAEDYGREVEKESKQQIELIGQTHPNLQHLDDEVDVVTDVEYFAVDSWTQIECDNFTTLDDNGVPEPQTVTAAPTKERHAAVPRKEALQKESQRCAKKRSPSRPIKSVRFTCQQCNWYSIEIKEYHEHLQKQHGIIKKHETFKCCYCRMFFKENSALQAHLTKEHSEKLKNMKYVCAECGRGFQKHFHHVQHAFVHNPEQRRYRCEMCTKAFGTARGLKFHVDSCHSKERPFKCTVCAKSFGVKTYLSNHMHRVHGPKSYTCPKCAQQFPQSKELDYHLLNLCPVLYKKSPSTTTTS